MKALKLGLVITAAALITFGLGGTALAFHDGGVAHCDGCHTMHNSADGAAVVTGTVGAHLQKGSDPSSTCLTCHAGYGQFKDGSAYRAGGDFYWLTKTFTWTAHGHAAASTGSSHGHNIIAADFTGLETGDDTLTTAPGGTYLAGQLGCNSCHDPHGTQGNAVLLYGVETTAKDYPGGYTFTHGAPVFKNAGRTANVADDLHSSFGSGMSEWCANCHAGFYNAIGKHVAGNVAGAALGGLASNYNAYVETGDLTGNSATSYLEIVPFETGATDSAALAATDSTQGPTANSNVMCLTCHRAHASPFPNMARWYFDDTLMEEAHPLTGDGGASADDIANKWYGRTISAEQRSFCNKCHVQD
jgi:hypothetical protein